MTTEENRVHGDDCVDDCGGCSCWCHAKPAEPKQGSEEPIEPVTELEAEKSTNRILRGLLAKAEAERDEARATKDMHKERQEEAWAEVAALRAQLADKDREVEAMWEQLRGRDEALSSAREEIANWRKQAEWNDATIATQAEEIEKAEARVADRATIAKQAEEIERLGSALGTLESRLFGLGEQTPICRLHRAGLSAMVDFIRAILARAKEGEKR